MEDFRENLGWKARWEERGQAVRNVLGETLPPSSVVPFSWKDYILPGACALTFSPSASRDYYLYMTLGLSQPLNVGDEAYQWEFAVCASQHDKWPVDLLYQLLTHWLCEKGNMGFGYYLPLAFFRDRSDNLWAGLTGDLSALDTVGSIRGLYLWADEERTRFRVSSGEFGILTVIAVTADEDLLAQASTPAHLRLFLKEMGITQVCDPYRPSVLATPEADRVWERIRAMTHDEVFDKLQTATAERLTRKAKGKG